MSIPRLRRVLTSLLSVGAMALLPIAAEAAERTAATTRSSGSSGGTVSSSSSSRSSSTSSQRGTTSSRSASSVRTRPSGSSDGRTVVTGDRRGSQPRGGGGRVVVSPWGWGWGPSWGPSWWGGFWGWPGVVSVVQGPYARGYGYGYAEGALDLDVVPEEAEVWIDGEQLGIADNFDGWPTHLWLPRGTYDLALYLPGHRTYARQITVAPGRVLRIDDRLERGEAIHPLDLPATSTARRDERLRRNEERRERAERWRDPRAVGPGAADDDWRQRGDRRPRRWEEDEEGYSIEVREASGTAEATLRLAVDPDDASVYLDGVFVGTARDLAAGLAVTPGTHSLDIVRPGYEEEERRFEVVAGEVVELDIELDD